MPRDGAAARRVEAPAAQRAAQAQALDLRMRREMAACESAQRLRRARCLLPLQSPVSLHPRRA